MSATRVVGDAALADEFAVPETLLAGLFTQFVPQALTLFRIETVLRQDMTGQHQQERGHQTRRPSGAPRAGPPTTRDSADRIDAHGPHSRHPAGTVLASVRKRCNRR